MIRLHHEDSNDVGFSQEACHSEVGGIVRTSRVLEVFFFLLAAFFGVSAIVFSVMGVVALASGQVTSLAEGVNGAFSVMDLFVYAAMLMLAGLICRDMAKGESPFTIKQANRIRIIAWLLLAYALLEAFLPTGVLLYQSYGGGAYGIEHNATFSPSIKVGSIIVATVFFFLSSIFKYGVKLQELSDDTV